MNDASSRVAYTDNVFEGFESGVLPAGWVVPAGADGGWTPENIVGFNSAWSLRSDSVGPNEAAVIEWPLVTHVSDLNLRIYRNAGAGDHLRIYINGELVHETTAN